jgi:hypothetical protein
VPSYRSMSWEDCNYHFNWCLLSLSRSSALSLHGLPIKSLPCLWPGKSLQALWCWYSVQFWIASLARHLGIPHQLFPYTVCL